MFEFLPQNVQDGLRHLNMQKLYEIRLRADKPTTVNYGGVYRYLGLFGVTDLSEKAIVCGMDEVADCVYRAGKYSVYSVEEQLKRGFLTAEKGVRIGIAGEYVFEKGQPLSVRNVSSLCIRVPHEVIGSGKIIYESCLQSLFCNLLIMSPPGLGKTTILRDLSRIIGEKTGKNVLICDERGEISAGEVGMSTDVLKFSDKETAFDVGIRTMRPDVIVTDELTVADCAAVRRAVVAGITVLASAHFASIHAVGKEFLGLFDRYVLLDSRVIGKIDKIYDAEGREIRYG